MASSHSATSSTGIVPNRDTDIFLGRGHDAQFDKGNTLFKNYIITNRQQFNESSNKNGKYSCCLHVYDELVHRGMRFIGVHRKKNQYVVLDQETAAQKIMEHFRSKWTQSTQQVTVIVPVAIKPIRKSKRLMAKATESTHSAMESDDGGSSTFKHVPIGECKSFIVPNFLQNHPGIEGAVKRVLDKLLLNESHHPSEPGPGVAVTAEACYGNAPKVSLLGTTYLKQNFGKNMKPTHKHNVVERATYGTGSGLVTHGIPYR